jgi:HPr kinase/phosphorylase
MTRRIHVEDLLAVDAAELQLRVVAGAGGEKRTLTNPQIQKPGLALAGYTGFLDQERLQILGSTELTYLTSLDADARRRAIAGLISQDVACIVCTKGMDIPVEVRAACDEAHICLFSTPQMTSVFISRIEAYLEDKLAPTTVMHGVMLEVYAVGVLILGKSGIGKSECALDLIQRGHRLIADDVVRIKRRGQETVYGTGEEMLHHHIEIRGLGILNVRDLFGVGAVREKKRIDMVVELVLWSEDEEYDRLGLEERRFPILGVELPLLTVPVRPGRNMGAIIEVAARNQLLRQMGVHTALDFADRLSFELAPGRRLHTDDVD